MPRFGKSNSHPVAVVEVDGIIWRASVQVSHDGIEYLGRLWFSQEDHESQEFLPDRGVIPGRVESDVVTSARRLRPDELEHRFRRALAEKRKYHGLRQLTGEILARIRYLNQVAVSIRSGLLDREAGNQELDLTEEQLLALVKQARQVAGVES